MGMQRSKKLKNELSIPTTASSSSPPSPPWIELPEDATANILQRLGAEEILETAQKVCTTWWKVCKDPAMWRVVDLRNSSGDDDLKSKLKFDLMCCCAVDRSQGQLTDLSITGFGEDELLNYVAIRSNHLRCLTLAHPNDISAPAVVEAVKKLPQLEELHLIAIWPLEAEHVEAIGMSCPLLKSFTYDEDMKVGLIKYYNVIGPAIAKTMPNLHHLRLVDEGTEKKGLKAILDGCLHLESLDVSLCYGLVLNNALKERCSKQIKFLSLPKEPS